jgi:hypothetical protein
MKSLIIIMILYSFSFLLDICRRTNINNKKQNFSLLSAQMLTISDLNEFMIEKNNIIIYFLLNEF